MYYNLTTTNCINKTALYNNNTKYLATYSTLSTNKLPNNQNKNTVQYHIYHLNITKNNPTTKNSTLHYPHDSNNDKKICIKQPNKNTYKSIKTLNYKTTLTNLTNNKNKNTSLFTSYPYQPNKNNYSNTNKLTYQFTNQINQIITITKTNNITNLDLITITKKNYTITTKTYLSIKNSTIMINTKTKKIYHMITNS